CAGAKGFGRARPRLLRASIITTAYPGRAATWLLVVGPFWGGFKWAIYRGAAAPGGFSDVRYRQEGRRQRSGRGLEGKRIPSPGRRAGRAACPVARSSRDWSVDPYRRRPARRGGPDHRGRGQRHGDAAEQ